MVSSDESDSTDGAPMSFEFQIPVTQDEVSDEDIKSVESIKDTAHSTNQNTTREATAHSTNETTNRENTIVDPNVALCEDDLWLKAALASKLAENQNLKFRRQLLYAFVFALPGNPPNFNTYFHVSMKDNPRILQIQQKLWQTRVKKHQSQAAFISDCLFTLWILIKESDQKHDDDMKSDNPQQRSSSRNGGTPEPKPILSLRKHMKTLLGRKKADQVKNASKNITKKSKDSDLIQDTFRRQNQGWSELIVTTPCPCCDHTSLVPSESESLLLQMTFDLKSKYKAEMIHWLALGKTQQKNSKKPKMPTFPKQYMMCMCIVSRCVDFHSGKGCPICTQRANSNALVLDPTSKVPICEVCSCNCMAYFDRMDWSKIKASSDVSKAKEEKAKSKRIADMKKAAGKKLFVFYYFMKTKHI